MAAGAKVRHVSGFPAGTRVSIPPMNEKGMVIRDIGTWLDVVMDCGRFMSVSKKLIEVLPDKPPVILKAMAEELARNETIIVSMTMTALATNYKIGELEAELDEAIDMVYEAKNMKKPEFDLADPLSLEIHSKAQKKIKTKEMEELEQEWFLQEQTDDVIEQN
jgi:hypothetical protein